MLRSFVDLATSAWDLRPSRAERRQNRAIEIFFDSRRLQPLRGLAA
jgi:hypothetical protein